MATVMLEKKAYRFFPLGTNHKHGHVLWPWGVGYFFFFWG